LLCQNGIRGFIRQMGGVLGPGSPGRPGCVCLDLVPPPRRHIPACGLGIPKRPVDCSTSYGRTCFASLFCVACAHSTTILQRNATELLSRVRLISSAASWGRILFGNLVPCCHINVIRKNLHRTLFLCGRCLQHCTAEVTMHSSQFLVPVLQPRHMDEFRCV